MYKWALKAASSGFCLVPFSLRLLVLSVPTIEYKYKEVNKHPKSSPFYAAGYQQSNIIEGFKLKVNSNLFLNLIKFSRNCSSISNP